MMGCTIWILRANKENIPDLIKKWPNPQTRESFTPYIKYIQWFGVI